MESSRPPVDRQGRKPVLVFWLFWMLITHFYPGFRFWAIFCSYDGTERS